MAKDKKTKIVSDHLIVMKEDKVYICTAGEGVDGFIYDNKEDVCSWLEGLSETGELDEGLCRVFVGKEISYQVNVKVTLKE